MFADLKKLKKIVASAYTKNDLEYPLKSWVIGFIKHYRVLYETKGLKDVLVMLDKKTRYSFNVDESMTFFASIFTDKEIFNAFYNHISVPLQIGFRELALAGGLRSDEMEKFTGLSSRDNELSMFPKRGYYWNPVFSMPFELKKLILSYLGYFAYNLEPIEALEKTDCVYNGAEHVFKEMPLLLTYVKQTPIPTTKQGRPTAAALKKVLKATKLEEFYPNEKGMTGVTKTLLSLFLILDLPNSKLQSFDSTEAVIDYLTKGIYIKKRRNSFYDLFFFQKGIHKRKIQSDGLEDAILNRMKKLPVNGWLSIENLFNYLYMTCDILPIHVSIAQEYIYPDYYFHNRDGKIKNAYNHFVQQPFIKGTFFLFAALGLVDIAYDNNPEELTFKGDVPNLYQKLKYVRLNDFGAYVLGINKEYIAPKQEFINELYLSSEALVITTNEDNPTAEIILKNYMTKVSNTRYVTDYETFLSNCNSVSDIRLKINSFKKALNIDFPKNWETFFTEIIDKSSSFQGRSFKVYELEKDSELIRLIARDEVLKSMIIKAENYHILIKNKDLPFLKKRLLKFGYFLK